MDRRTVLKSSVLLVGALPGVKMVGKAGEWLDGKCLSRFTSYAFDPAGEVVRCGRDIDHEGTHSRYVSVGKNLRVYAWNDLGEPPPSEKGDSIGYHFYKATAEEKHRVLSVLMNRANLELQPGQTYEIREKSYPTHPLVPRKHARGYWYLANGQPSASVVWERAMNHAAAWLWKPSPADCPRGFAAYGLEPGPLFLRKLGEGIDLPDQGYRLVGRLMAT